MLRNILNCEKKSAKRNRSAYDDNQIGMGHRRHNKDEFSSWGYKDEFMRELQTAPQNDNAKLVWKYDVNRDGYVYYGCPAN